MVKITFAQGNIADAGDLLTRTHSQLHYLAEEHGFGLPEAGIREQFEWPLHHLTKHYNESLVVLVDEYDKPILDRLGQPAVTSAMREVLKGFSAIDFRVIRLYDYRTF